MEWKCSSTFLTWALDEGSSHIHTLATSLLQQAPVPELMAGWTTEKVRWRDEKHVLPLPWIKAQSLPCSAHNIVTTLTWIFLIFILFVMKTKWLLKLERRKVLSSDNFIFKFLDQYWNLIFLVYRAPYNVGRKFQHWKKLPPPPSR